MRGFIESNESLLDHLIDTKKMICKVIRELTDLEEAEETPTKGLGRYKY